MGNSASDKSNVIARSTPERAKRAEGCDEAISDLLEDYELQRVTRNDAQPTNVRDYTITIPRRKLLLILPCESDKLVMMNVI